MTLLNLGNRSTLNSKKFRNVSQCIPTIKMAWFGKLELSILACQYFIFHTLIQIKIYGHYGYMLITIWKFPRFMHFDWILITINNLLTTKIIFNNITTDKTFKLSDWLKL